MCMKNDMYQKVLDARARTPQVMKFYKAVKNYGLGNVFSHRGVPSWVKGWHEAVGSLTKHFAPAEIEQYLRTGIVPENLEVHGGAFHLAANLKSARAWCEDDGVCNAVIEVFVYPSDIIAWGTPNHEYGREEVAVTRCFVKDPKIVWSPEIEAQRRAKARLRRSKKSLTTKKRK